ncbi:MAG: hypothetical protein H6569_12050 [Lewinellaceae bacterium]|nr:hypothetical protein [Lewinellaceae bacterium]
MTTKLTGLLAFLLLPTLLTAQLQWEHRYPGINLERRMLDLSGEVYLLSDNCTLELFGKDHSPRQTIPLDPTPGDACGYYLLSEASVDADPELEVVYSWALVDHLPLNGSALRDDNGQNTDLIYGLNQATFSMPPGLAPKLLSGPAVYSLPGVVLEHEYGANDFVYRIPRTNGADNYLVYDYEVDDDKFTGFHFYDGAHQWIKTVKISPELRTVSQHSFNQDDLFEFAGTVWVSNTDPNSKRLLVVQEDGTVLQNLPCTSARLDRQPPLPDRYFVQDQTPQGALRTRVFQLAPWEVLEEFENKYVTRYALNGQEELFVVQPKNGDSLLQIYDATFSLIRVFTMPKPYQHFWDLQFTRNAFSQSGLLELCFSNFRQGEYYVTCIDESGALLYDFPLARQARVDRQAGMEDRFFVHYPDSTVVYRFDFSSAVTTVSKPEVRLFPNPVAPDGAIHIRYASKANPAHTARLCTVTGARVQSWALDPLAEIHHLDFSTLALPAGMYWIQLTDQRGLSLATMKCVLTK